MKYKISNENSKKSVYSLIKEDYKDLYNLSGNTHLLKHNLYRLITFKLLVLLYSNFRIPLENELKTLEDEI